jgi:hypothetical protein
MQDLNKWIAAYEDRIDNLDYYFKFEPEIFCKAYLEGSNALKGLNLSKKETKALRNKFSSYFKAFAISQCQDFTIRDAMWDLLDWVQWRKYKTNSDKYVNAFSFAEKHLQVRYGTLVKHESKIPNHKWLKTDRQIIYCLIRLSNLRAFRQSRNIDIG